MAFVSPLDFESIFVNTFAGGWEIFIFIAGILISAMAAKFKMPTILFMSMVGLFAFTIANWVSWVYAVVVVVGAMGIFFMIARLVKV